jgi:dienelactone hydrolase
LTRPARRSTRTERLILLLWVCSAACGDGGGATSPHTAAGALTVAACVIAEGASSCETVINWTTTGALAPRVVLGNTTLATASAGSVRVEVGTTVQTVTLFDGEARLDEGTVRGQCVSASAWNGSQCRAFARRIEERVPTPFTEGGRPVSLELILFQPMGVGPFPAVMFHHGSTGNGTDPSLFALTYTNEAVARFFTERGWSVAFAQRRGRGNSDGLYDEGFTPDRASYSCLQGPALAGFDRALQDVDVAVGYVRARSDVDGARLISAGVSRGGALAVAHAGMRPGLFQGVVNFVGGWLGEGCTDAAVVNRTAFVRGATFERRSTWLYGENDPFYSVAHSRSNFDAFVAAGGRGSFFTYSLAPTLNGHFIINDPSLWTADLEAFLTALGSP